MAPGIPDGVSIDALPADRIDELAPLWDALREHHLSVAPPWLPPAYPAEESWRRRARQYGEWLADPDSFGLVARRGHGVVGDALVHLRGGSPTRPTAARAGGREAVGG